MCHARLSLPKILCRPREMSFPQQDSERQAYCESLKLHDPRLLSRSLFPLSHLIQTRIRGGGEFARSDSRVNLDPGKSFPSEIGPLPHLLQHRVTCSGGGKFNRFLTRWRDVIDAAKQSQHNHDGTGGKQSPHTEM